MIKFHEVTKVILTAAAIAPCIADLIIEFDCAKLKATVAIAAIIEQGIEEANKDTTAPGNLFNSQPIETQKAK